ncbi:hypothetical protein [Asticcacaulis sp. AC402]|uniref:phosphatase domain-containing protein n=1 Tax=Asticcacaulis sp. AC402 TaxID=1282361 RepID=UPI0003C3F197|nr:hypothetical protein [Asticcacaulis sp. AC402]ESQ77416.1 hypothetical protein ABAC402_01365 [Asticcacaulis sp. AC402]
MQRDIIVFDLDGTIADIDHRKHHITGGRRNWRQFFADCVDDKPLEAVIVILRNLYPKFRVCILTGRSDEVRKETEAWLAQHQVPYHELIMRRRGDNTPDNVLKLAWVEDGVVPKERILCVFDDRDKVVKMWRKAGIACFQVAEGDF